MGPPLSSAIAITGPSCTSVGGDSSATGTASSNTNDNAVQATAAPSVVTKQPAVATETAAAAAASHLFPAEAAHNDVPIPTTAAALLPTEPPRRTSSAGAFARPTSFRPAVTTHPGTLNPHIPIAFNNKPSSSSSSSSNNNSSSSSSSNNNNNSNNGSSTVAGNFSCNSSNNLAATTRRSSSTGSSSTASAFPSYTSLNANNVVALDALPAPAMAAQKISAAAGGTAASTAATPAAAIPTGFLSPALAPYTQKRATSKQVQAHHMPDRYTPTEHDVLCGRGRNCKVWPGNQAYRRQVAQQLDAYSIAGSKLDKGYILSEIVDFIRNQGGQFIKKDPDGNWFEVGDFQAREKTSQAFRDALHEQYSSSAQSKYNRRKERESSAVGVRATPRRGVDVELYKQPGDASVARIHASLKANKEYYQRQEQQPQQQQQQQQQIPQPQQQQPQQQQQQIPQHPPQQQQQEENSISDTPESQPIPPKKRKPSEDQWETPKAKPAEETADNRRPIEDDVASVLQNMAGSTNSPSDAAGDCIRVCALQLKMREADEPPMIAAQHAVDRMSTVVSNNSNNNKVDLFVLPELAPLGYSEDTFRRFLPNSPQNQQLLQNIDDIFAYQARRLNAFICYGTIGWQDSASNADGNNQQQPPFFIRQIVLDRSGTRVATYDKIHLCDYGSCSETRFFTPGPQVPVSFSIDGFRFGILICADIRYAELSRKLAREHKVDALLQPSAFARDISFRSWKSFQETRAIENSVFFLAVNYAGTDFGGTSVVRPWVDEKHEPEMLGTGEGFLIGNVDRTELNAVRTNMPFYRHLLANDDAWK